MIDLLIKTYLIGLACFLVAALFVIIRDTCKGHALSKHQMYRLSVTALKWPVLTAAFFLHTIHRVLYGAMNGYSPPPCSHNEN